jgi:bifunctional DNase/RNase
MQVQFEKNSLDLFTRSERFHKPKVDRAGPGSPNGWTHPAANSIHQNNSPATHTLTPRNGAHNPPTLRSLFFVSMQITFASMNKTVIEVQVRAVLPTSGGCAVFLGNNDKVFIIYVDQTVGSAITMFMRDISKERPLTHDLIAHLMAAVGAKVERVIINDLKNATYYARMIIRAENELQQKKIIELDGRPSDCIAMATQQKAPIYVSQEVWDEVDDMSDVLRKMEEDGLKPDPETESTEEE